jgi:hypothetical protein
MLAVRMLFTPSGLAVSIMVLLAVLAHAHTQVLAMLRVIFYDFWDKNM